MQKIIPCLWFDNEAETAAQFYLSIFKNSKIIDTAKYLVDTPSNKPIGSVMTVTFELDGQKFMALNGGPYFKLSEAMSLIINCKDQTEINYFYDKLSAVPEAEICGWIKDKFGVSWQLVTDDFDKLMIGKNASKVMAELLKMKRIDVEKLKKISEE
jgi:predicted 3-demethylubiquinone-9 3-methyltransferase (glyoxalase superfamily)